MRRLVGTILIVVCGFFHAMLLYAVLRLLTGQAALPEENWGLQVISLGVLLFLSGLGIFAGVRLWPQNQVLSGSAEKRTGEPPRSAILFGRVVTGIGVIGLYAIFSTEWENGLSPWGPELAYFRNSSFVFLCVGLAMLVWLRRSVSRPTPEE